MLLYFLKLIKISVDKYVVGEIYYKYRLIKGGDYMSNNTLIHCHNDYSKGVTNIASVTKNCDYIERA